MKNLIIRITTIFIIGTMSSQLHAQDQGTVTDRSTQAFQWILESNVGNGHGGTQMKLNRNDFALFPVIVESGSLSGGRLRLKSELNNGTDWLIDNSKNRFRVFTDGYERISVNTKSEVAISAYPGSLSEGGEIKLLGAAGNNPWHLDNVNGWFRLHHSGAVWFAVSNSGQVQSKSIKVTNSPTADFVFKSDYKLPKLSEVEKFILNNKHLPEIQSAKNMTENGVIIEEFQIKLLQKIEELTLYTIAQQKRLDKQQSDIESLQSVIKTLQQ